MNSAQSNITRHNWYEKSVFRVKTQMDCHDLCPEAGDQATNRGN
jgi:hypothetical protein